MAAASVTKRSFCFEFVGYGTQVPVCMVHTDCLFLDVGNCLGSGVIDHHHLAAYTGSTAGLLLLHPNFIHGSLNPKRQLEDPFTIVLHKKPDLDCLISTYFAIMHLVTGHFDKGAESLARYADKVDGGYLGFSQNNPFSLYAAYMQLSHRLSTYSWETKTAMWTEWIRQGLKIAEFVSQKIVTENKSVLDIDAFQCPGLFGQKDRQDVEGDLQRYLNKLSDERCRTKRIQINLPCVFGGKKKVDTLIARDVQNSSDPEKCIFFKDWARSDKRYSQNGQGFVALMVFESESHQSPRRCVISVQPDSSVMLKGLGANLDQAESEKRIKAYGHDDRVMDLKTYRPKQPREGYDNADPWYDGRSHGYTIVDSPRSGTLLTPEEIEAIFMDFGSASSSVSEPLTLPPLDVEFDTAESTDVAMCQFSMLVDTWKLHQPSAKKESEIEVFISYPRKKQTWVTQNVYAPLVARHGKEKIFFDQHSISGGAGWLAYLAEGIAECRHFLAICCKAYFNTPYCKWELQKAFMRDPAGEKRIMVPVMIENVGLPEFCNNIQCIKVYNAKDLPEAMNRALRFL
jgi:hypothetical protein